LGKPKRDRQHQDDMQTIKGQQITHMPVKTEALESIGKTKK
jgi:hypothetical protein